jgi:hypothetical protein
MGNLTKIVLIAILVAIIGGGIFLATWQIPAPAAPVERVIPNDRFPN